MLVGAPLKSLHEGIAQEHLEELTRLTDTAGGQVVDIVRQRIDAPHPRFYVGKGKVEELRECVASAEADLVIFDDELTPAQGKALEDHIGVRVMDRAELILDIFATRARTGEAKMQVELAQLQYLLPRLKLMWTHLSRIRGGVGLRGPGEMQLETDRRMIGRRIADLRKKLESMTQAQAVQRQSREGKFRVALVGYTNAGKSSLLRALSGSDLFIEDRLFATLDSATRSVDLGEGFEILVTDTVGFIRKLPHHLVASFRSTLEEAREADLLAHVIDASHAAWKEQKGVVEDVLDELDLGDRPQILVFNKIDQLTHAEEEALSRRIRAFDTTPAFFCQRFDRTRSSRSGPYSRPGFEPGSATSRCGSAHMMVRLWRCCTGRVKYSTSLNTATFSSWRSASPNPSPAAFFSGGVSSWLATTSRRHEGSDPITF